MALTTWTTNDELEFLDLMAKGKVYNQSPLNTTPVKKLIGYLRAAKHRSDWGRIDADTATQYARALLRDLTKGIANNEFPSHDYIDGTATVGNGTGTPRTADASGAATQLHAAQGSAD